MHSPVTLVRCRMSVRVEIHMSQSVCVCVKACADRYEYGSAFTQGDTEW